MRDKERRDKRIGKGHSGNKSYESPLPVHNIQSCFSIILLDVAHHTSANFKNEKNLVLGKNMTIFIFLIFKSFRGILNRADSI